MPSWGWVLIAIGIVVVLALVAWSAYRSRRRRGLQDRFGPEYDRTVADAPSRREAESELSERQKRRDELEIRPLSAESRDRYASRWHNTQAKFVDEPEEAVGEADGLIQEVMRERGYPVDDFDQRARRTCARRWSTTARCSWSCSRPSPPRRRGRSCLTAGPGCAYPA